MFQHVETDNRIERARRVDWQLGEDIDVGPAFLGQLLGKRPLNRRRLDERHPISQPR